MSEKHREYFNAISDHWDQRRPDYARLEEILGRTEIQSGMRVLDVGAGTGCMARLLLKAVGKGGQVFALDLAEQMLVKAANNPELMSADIICSDVHWLPFCNEYIDAVMCFAAFPHFANKALALREIYRVLKPSGQIYIVHPMGSREMNEHHRSIGGVVGEDVLPDGDTLLPMLSDVQFRKVSIIDQPDLYFARALK